MPTKPKNLVTSIDELTIDNVEAEANAAALLAAKDDYEDATLRLKEAHDDLKVLHQSAFQGSMIDPEEIKNLRARVEVEESYQSGSAARLRIIKDKRLVLDLDLLATVYAALENILPGVPLLVGLGAAPTEAPKGDLPILVLTQDQGSKVALNGGGSPHIEGGLAGRLHLRFFRSDDLHQPLTEDRLQRVLEAGHINAVVRVKSLPGQDHVTIEVTRAIPEVPQVPYPVTEAGATDTREGISWLSGIVGNASTTHSGHYLFGKRIDPRDPGRWINGVYTLNATKVRSTVESVTVREGRRLVALSTTATVVSKHGDLPALEAAIRKTRDLPVGAATELGRVCKSELQIVEVALEDGKSRGLRLTLVLTLASKAA